MDRKQVIITRNIIPVCALWAAATTSDMTPSQGKNVHTYRHTYIQSAGATKAPCVCFAPAVEVGSRHRPDRILAPGWTPWHAGDAAIGGKRRRRNAAVREHIQLCRTIARYRPNLGFSGRACGEGRGAGRSRTSHTSPIYVGPGWVGS